jgi:hypothetical protein
MSKVPLHNFFQRRRGLLGFASGVVACGLIGGGVAFATSPSTATGAFTACVNNVSGAVRIIVFQAGHRCGKTEHVVSWSKGNTYRGAWNSTVTYNVLDVITYSGSSYLAKIGSHDQIPGSSPASWGLLAARGDKGSDGTNFTADTTLAAGATLTGQWNARGSGVGTIGVAVNYRIPLAAVPAANTAEFIKVFPSTSTNCPAPGIAAAGFLCVYSLNDYHASNPIIYAAEGLSFPSGRGGKDGFQIGFDAYTTGAAYSYGSWAMTAPNS